MNIASFYCHYYPCVEVFLFSFFDGLVLVCWKVLEGRSVFCLITASFFVFYSASLMFSVFFMFLSLVGFMLCDIVLLG